MVQKALSGYVVSLARLHEWGFDVPAGDFIRALCHYYGVIANFNRRRVLTLMERRLFLFKMTEGAPSEVTQMAAEPLSDEVATQRAGKGVTQPPNNPGDFWRVAMHPDEGYISVVSRIPHPRH